MPVMSVLDRHGILRDLMLAGAVVRTPMCGPCFGAGDTPANGALSIRHNTRNFPNREGSYVGQGQMAAAALMDARSIARPRRTGACLRAPRLFSCWEDFDDYEFDSQPYERRVYNGFAQPRPDEPLVYGPNIQDWPELEPLAENIALQVCTMIMDPVTNTDEVIPPERRRAIVPTPSSWRSSPCPAATPAYIGRARQVREFEMSVCRDACPLGTSMC